MKNIFLQALKRRGQWVDLERLVVEAHKLNRRAQDIWAEWGPPQGEEDIAAANGGVVMMPEEYRTIHVRQSGASMVERQRRLLRVARSTTTAQCAGDNC